ncbi:hypothetical protein [Corynebacterium glutamicum]|uniref:hypothetical protein n=1 Tax=Corynebacterium glutamicum TaxID=1718 RepID=UPI001B8D786C|nr:hypothetical protein [Corynebacterium glutamicum]
MGYLCDRLVVLGVSIVGGKILTVVESMFHECLGDHREARVFVRPQLLDYLDRLAAGLNVMGLRPPSRLRPDPRCRPEDPGRC